ncbi:MAG TPA: hypothetical protein VIH57_13785 [Bacteroidales bacterium]
MKRYFLLLTMIMLILTSFSNIFGQLVGSTINTQTPAQEIRKGSTVQYTAPAGAAGEQYSWEIIGGTPTPAATSGSGTVADPYIINFTADLTSITVQWNNDAQAITSANGRIRVQKKNGGCISLIQSLELTCWSNATATITDADIDMCSGDATPGNITLQFTGAPNFDLRYTVTDLDGTVSTEKVITGVSGSSTTIPLPANLINTSTTADQTYKITLTQMNDAFQGDGTFADASYTITVHPAISTGTIQASPSALQRR